MSLLATALIFRAFLGLGTIAKLAIGVWMKRSGTDGPDR